MARTKQTARKDTGGKPLAMGRGRGKGNLKKNPTPEARSEAETVMVMMMTLTSAGRQVKMHHQNQWWLVKSHARRPPVTPD